MRVLYFHSLRQMTGCREEEIGGSFATVNDLLSALFVRHEGLEALRPSLMIAVNEEWADGATPLSDDDEVALMPPVSGG